MAAILNTLQSGKAGRNYGYSDFLPMLNSTSVKTRFLVSVGTNLVRSIFGFASGLLVARGLGPSSYGDLAFLLGSFSAILSLIDMGSANAFYTFLSRRAQGLAFFLTYFLWVGLQLLITLLFVAWIIPDSLFQRIWLGHDREIVIVALLVVFLQQQVWQTVTQIGESMRKTVKVQLLNLFITITYLVGIVILTVLAKLSLTSIMLLMIGQYVIGAALAYWVLGRSLIVTTDEEASLKKMAQDYWKFCGPLIMLSLAVFLYNFADKWMLQNFGGSIQQGYFQIANQFAAVSLLATSSILSVFWKEIAHAWENNDIARVERLYRKVSRGLVMVGAIISGLLIPWALQIVTITLGIQYAQAWPVLALMLLYPIHQSMGQIGGTMFVARGQTKMHMYITVCTIAVSIPITYLLLAPMVDFGLGMGAMGLAIKNVLLGVISVNIQAWIIARNSGWKFDWVFQVVGISLMIMIGYFAKFLVSQAWNLDNISVTSLIAPVMLDCLLYAVLVLWLIRLQPWLLGLEKDDVVNMIKSLELRIKLVFTGTGAS